MQTQIHIADVLQLLGISYPKNRTDVYVKCPSCDFDGNGKHLNVNLKKDVFRCPKCGVSGGIRDFYALYKNIENQEAFREIRKKLGSNYIPLKEEPEIFEYPLNDLISRDKTYRDFLDMLTLSPIHRENLHNRGLSDEQIEKYGFKSAPVVNHLSYAYKLQMKGDYLSGVPGFYKKGLNWTFARTGSGILIPVKDHKGRIQGIQIRLDDTTKGSKYRWISSSGKKDGCKARSFVHLVGENFKGNPLVITEGPLKADIAYEYLHKNILAVAGVNATKDLEKIIHFLRPSRIITAFDMDYQTNPNVKKALAELYMILERTGVPYSTYIWNPKYKGIDDFLVAKKKKN